jgi:hypothetical protein
MLTYLIKYSKVRLSRAGLSLLQLILKQLIIIKIFNNLDAKIMITHPFATNYTMLHSSPANWDNPFIKLSARTLLCMQIYPDQFTI